jgi:hypothetical protein
VFIFVYEMVKHVGYNCVSRRATACMLYTTSEMNYAIKYHARR